MAQNKTLHQDEFNKLKQFLVEIISETNGISLYDTLELLEYSSHMQAYPKLLPHVRGFKRMLDDFQNDNIDIKNLLDHPFSLALYDFFKHFPIKYREEHIHLTGSLSSDFVYRKLKPLLESKDKDYYIERIKDVYELEEVSIESPKDVDDLIRLKEDELFDTYLKILFLPKLILNTKEDHYDAAFHMASELYQRYNVGHIRLKFTLNRSTNNQQEKVPGSHNLTEEDVVLGLYEGFKAFQKDHPDFNFILSPSFRKEANFFDGANFLSKKDHFLHQVECLLEMREKYPFLEKHLLEIDTVGDEKELFRKKHFEEMKSGLRKLQYKGIRIRSHHGETWKTLRRGIQSVDNAMNIWHIDTLEHGLSLGINPNYYFHRIYQRVIEQNQKNIPIHHKSKDYLEIVEMDWQDQGVKEKLLKGEPLNESERVLFLKTKFHTAREVEHYQHDVLNRVIYKNVSLVALPTSNMKLTNSFPDYKDHPFSWWEKKGVKLGVGTDNYITLSTDYIKEMLILLYSDADKLKITKLLMVATKESRRPFISHLLWKMRKEMFSI